MKANYWLLACFTTNPILQFFPTKSTDLHPSRPCLVLFLKEFDDDRGEHFGVNHVGLTFERLAAGVWQDFGQRISGRVYPGVARTTICNHHRPRTLAPPITCHPFPLHPIASNNV